MIPPVTYQGGKQRLADEIVAKMSVLSDVTFYDLCCGSGAISLALVEKGHDPKKIVMVDRGPWGLFWSAIGDGSFDVGRFRELCSAVPRDPREIKQHIERLHREPCEEDVVYVYLLLQATAIGGKAVWINGTNWARGSGFRDYWLPTETSSRRSPVNPMMPMPDTILNRVAEIARRMRGVQGHCMDAEYIPIEHPAVVYIDPQYEGTTGYPYTIDAVATAISAGVPCWVSEGKPLSPNAVCLSSGRAKGGITGERKRAANEEWLSYFGPDVVQSTEPTWSDLVAETCNDG